MTKSTIYKIPKEKLLILKDAASGARSGKIAYDKRVQVKMPNYVVKALDSMFPYIDRSELITRLAADMVYKKLLYEDDETLALLADAEDEDMLDLWSSVVKYEGEVPDISSWVKLPEGFPEKYE